MVVGASGTVPLWLRGNNLKHLQGVDKLYQNYFCSHPKCSIVELCIDTEKSAGDMTERQDFD